MLHLWWNVVTFFFSFQILNLDHVEILIILWINCVQSISVTQWTTIKLCPSISQLKKRIIRCIMRQNIVVILLSCSLSCIRKSAWLMVSPNTSIHNWYLIWSKLIDILKYDNKSWPRCCFLLLCWQRLCAVLHQSTWTLPGLSWTPSLASPLRTATKLPRVPSLGRSGLSCFHH